MHLSIFSLQTPTLRLGTEEVASNLAQNGFLRFFSLLNEYAVYSRLVKEGTGTLLSLNLFLFRSGALGASKSFFLGQGMILLGARPVVGRAKQAKNCLLKR